MAAAAAVLEVDSFLSSIISAIPRTFEAQKTAHRNFRIPTLFDFTAKQEIGNILEAAAKATPAPFTPTGTQVENEDNGLEICEEDEDADRINMTTDWTVLERESEGTFRGSGKKVRREMRVRERERVCVFLSGEETRAFHRPIVCVIQLFEFFLKKNS